MADRLNQNRSCPQRKTRTLPLLGQIVFPWQFAQPKERDAALLILLRKVALKSRNVEQQPFYSIRAVAKRFDISATAVSRIYVHLKEEGVLSSAWGARTNMQPSHLDRQLFLRGRITLLLAFEQFCVTRQYRADIVGLCEELWKRGFATQLCFCETEDFGRLPFFQAIAHEKPDAVIWFLESRGCSSAAHCFIDRGIRLIGFGQHQDEIVQRTLAFAQEPPASIPSITSDVRTVPLPNRTPANLRAAPNLDSSRPPSVQTCKC